MTSGFIRLSKLGPIELKLDFIFDESTEPTVITETASAGAPMCGSAVLPSFPAEATTIIPLLKATSAPREIKLVLPFISL
ncbi:hypothetical protein D3C72_2494040 [compost metagenome]